MNINFIKKLLIILLVISLSSAWAKKINPQLSMLKSAVLPGWGELSNNNKAGYAFIASELIFWSSKFYFIQEGKIKETESINFAIKYAGIESISSYSDKFYEDLKRYSSYGYESGGYNAFIVDQAENIYPDDYNAQQEYIQDHIYSDDFFWDWESKDKRKEYGILRKRITQYADYSKTMTGAIIANHIVSALHSLISTAKKKRRYELGFYLDNKMNPNLVYKYKF